MTRGSPPLLDVAVVGAGISGLVTAFYLARGGRRVAVLEASDRVGGAIRSHEEAGFRFELGPNTVLANDPSVDALLADAALEDERLVAAPTSKKRYIWKGGRLVPLPGGPGGFLTTPLFSPGAKLRIFREPFVRPLDGDAEESVAAFVRRRLGPEMLDYAVGPFVSGVYAGDPERLSMRWAVRKLWTLEQAHGSLIRGAFAKKKGPAPGGKMFTLEPGLEALPRRLAERIGDVRTLAPVRTVTRDAEGFVLDLEDGEVRAKRVVLAVPADALATLLEALSDGASRELADIPYAPVVSVALGFRRADVRHSLEGFGFLAPRKEDLRLLGCLFPSSLFAHRAPADHVALAAFAGGRTDPAILELDDGEIAAFVHAELDRALGLGDQPVLRVIRRWPRAIPQYEMGHGRHVAFVDALERENPGLYVGGNVLGGISVPDCIRKAAALADRLLAT